MDTGPNAPLIHETACTFEHNGKTFTNQGAYVDANYANVYVVPKWDKSKAEPWVTFINVTDWHGKILGQGRVTSSWRQNHAAGSYRMQSVTFKIGMWWYTGRYAPDYGNLVKAKRTTTALKVY